MSGNFLVSPGPLLDVLLKEVQNCLDPYPEVAMTRENIEKLFKRFRNLFKGGYRPVVYQTVKLHSCIMGFCECIMIFIKDSTYIKQQDHFYIIDRWMAILDNLGSLESIKNKFIFFKPILLNPTLDDLPLWFYKEFMIHLNRVFVTTNELAVFHKKELKPLFKTVSKWLKLIMTCGDYEFQTILVRSIISICEKRHIEYVFEHEVCSTGDTFKMFLAVHSQKDYVNDLQVFLSSINDHFHKVHSVPCLKVTLQETVISPLKGMNGDVTWMHINYGFRTFSFSCHQNSLRSPPGPDDYLNVFEFVAVHFDDISQVCLLINNDSKTDNSAVGMFVLKLSGKCSCRFKSSREMVSLIKEIAVMVPNGVHKEFLKEELIKLFGKKFKEDIQTPIKRGKWLGKKHSRWNLSSQSLSFRAENRRRMKKRTDSMTSSQGSFLTPNLKLNNSFTSENKENVSGDSKEFSQIFTGMHSDSNMSLSNNRLMIENININVNETKEDKSVLKSKSSNCAVKTNLTLKINSKKKNNLEAAAHLKTQKKRYEDITKKNSLLLKNSDSGILSTFESKENMTKNSEIFPTNILPREEEEMENPSNYRFGEDNSLSIFEKSRDSIFDFKPEGMNSGTNSSISKTISKDYGLDLDLSLAPSSSKESWMHDFKNIVNLPTNLPKIKNKEQTRSALSTKLKMSDSYTFQNTDKIIDGKNLNRNDHSYALENRVLINEKVFDDEIVKDEENKNENSETFKDGQIVEESEYYSIVTDSASTEENKESNYSEAFASYLEKNNALMQLFNMNTEDIKNIEIVDMTKNDDLLTLGNQTVNVAESECWSINPGDTPVENNFEKLCKQETTNEESKNNNFFLGQQESEYYSFDPEIILTEDNEVCDEDIKICNSETPDLKFNVGSNGNIATLTVGTLKELTKVSDSYNLKSITEQVIENEDSTNLELTVQPVSSSEEIEYFSIDSDDQGTNQLSEDFETPDCDFILANCSNIVSPHVESKNANTNISTAHENEIIKRDHSYTLKNTKEQVLDKEEIQKNHNLFITDYQRSKCFVDSRDYTFEKVDELTAHIKNVNEKISNPSNIRLSTETVKLDNWNSDNISEEIFRYIGKLHANEDQEKDHDNISVISISSTEEIDSHVKTFVQESEHFSIASDDQGSNQLGERSETPDRDFILTNCANIVSPHVESKNANTNISTTHENEIIKRDHSYTLKNTKEQVLDEEEIQKNHNLFITDYQRSKCFVESRDYTFEKVDELTANIKNVNEKISNPSNIRLSTETVKLDNWELPHKISEEIFSYIEKLHANEDQEKDYDNISVISISSTEEIDSHVETFFQESEHFPIASDDQGSNQLGERSATPDFILANCTNVFSPHVESKNANTNISTTHANEIIKRDHSYTLKYPKEQVLEEEEIQKNHNLIVKEFQKSKGIVDSCGYPFKTVDELNTNNENVNKEIDKITNIHPSIEKGKIDNWELSKEIIPYVKNLHTNEDQENNDDNISIISITSTEEIYSDVEFCNSLTKATDIQDVQKLLKNVSKKMVKNYQIKNKTFTEKQMEYNQLEDMVKTIKHMKNLLIPDVIQGESEKEVPNNLNIICTPSIEENVSDAKLNNNIDNTVTEIEDGVIAEKEIENSTQYYVAKTNADAENFQISVINAIPEVSENQELHDQLNVIFNLPTEGSVSGAEFDDKTTKIHSPENIENVTKDEHSSFAKEIEIAMQFDDIAESDADMEIKQITEIIKSIENDHCYYFNQNLSHEVENKNDEDNVINFTSSASSGSIDKLSMHGLNEFNMDHPDFGLTQHKDVKEIDFQQKFDQMGENHVVDLRKTKSDVSLTYLLNRHQQSLDKSNTSTEDLQNSFTVMNSKSMEQVSSKASCDKQNKSTNTHFAQNKIKILSNIRIAPPLNAKINQSHRNDQLVDEKYASLISELREANAKLAHTTQTLDALKLSFNLQTNKDIENRSIEGKKRTLTQEHETNKDRNDKIDSFQEFIESTSNSLPDNNFLLDKFITNVEGKSFQDQSNLADNEIYEISDEDIQKVHNTQGLPPKKFLLNKFYTSLKESTKSTCKTNTSTETDFEMLIPRNEESNPEELELSFKILSPQKSLFDVIAAKERKKPIQLTRNLQKPEESYFDEFLSFLSNTSPLNNFGEKENTVKLSQDGKRSDFKKLKVQKKKMDDQEEFDLTLQSKKRLPDEADTSKSEKRRKLLEEVQLSEEKENGFEVLASKKLPFRKFNENKKSTPVVQLTQIKQKSKVSDWEMIETDNREPYHSKEFVSIRKASEKSFATSKSENTLERRNRKIDEGVNSIKKYESSHLDKGAQVQERNLIKEVQSVGRKQKSKENNFEKLEVINEEEFRLSTKNLSELDQNIDFDWDDFKIGKENNDRLYNILNHPRRVYTICDKTGEALKFGKPVAYKSKEVQNDEEFYKVADSIYGFDAMLVGLRSYLKTCDSTQKKKRKPQKKKITKMKLFVPMKVKSKSKKKKLGKLS